MQMAPSAIWPEASILKELVREGENPQRTLGWGSSRDRDVLKAESRSQILPWGLHWWWKGRGLVPREGTIEGLVASS